MLQMRTEIDPKCIEDTLREILASQFFRSSGQCSSLFRYIVENSMQDRDECLRERVIGSEVFDRPPDYDTGNDHIVRSRASEVRKRLAQFYGERGLNTSVRITIPTGSYRATFDWAAQRELGGDSATDSFNTEPAKQSAPLGVPEEFPSSYTKAAGTVQQALRSPVGRKWIYAIVCFTGFFLIGSWAIKGLNRQNKLERFWAPLIRSNKPVLIYCGGGFVYKLSDQFLDDYRSKHGLRDSRREFFVDLKQGEQISAADLVADRHFVPFGDLASASRIVSNLSKFNKPYDLRYGDDVAFTEFRSSPVILIGGLNNSWALRVTRNLRFVLNDDDRIVDKWHKEKIWTQKADSDNLSRDDYAVISRLSQAETGGFVLSIAGIRMYGTRAAADLITDPASMERLLKDAPRGWEQKNMQIVIHTKAINDIPVSVDVEAVHYW